MMDKLKAVEKMNKGISVVWYTPPNRWDKYKQICIKYGYDYKQEEMWFRDKNGEQNFFDFLRELRDNDIIVMNAN